MIIWDNHNGSLNLHYDLLDERCDIALGVNFSHRFPGMDESFSGVALVGYHAMDNTVDAVICHTFSSEAYQYMKVNGEEVGEIGIDGSVAGERGVPVIFVASDDKGTAEAQRIFPGVETVTTKMAMGWNAAVSKHPKRVIAEIYETIQKVMPKLKKIKPFTFPSPIEFEIRFKRIEAAQAATRGFKIGDRVDPYTVRHTLQSMQEYF